MTYEDRERHRVLVERLAALRDRLEAGEPAAPVTREEALALVELLDEIADRLSPQRMDRLMETVADEASRRAGAMAPSR
jgi:hypothetical protein